MMGRVMWRSRSRVVSILLRRDDGWCWCVFMKLCSVEAWRWREEMDVIARMNDEGISKSGRLLAQQ